MNDLALSPRYQLLTLWQPGREFIQKYVRRAPLSFDLYNFLLCAILLFLMHDHTHTSTNVFSLKGAVVKIDIIRLELKVGTICVKDKQGGLWGARTLPISEQQ